MPKLKTSDSERGGAIKEIIIVLVLIIAGLIGYHFYSQQQKSDRASMQDRADDIQSQVNETYTDPDDAATAPVGAKRAREMENISDMY